MPLDAKIAAMLSGRSMLSINEASIADYRAYVRQVSTARGPLAVRLGAVSEREIPGPVGPLRVRLYQPAGEGPYPLLVYFHGGGWVVGDLDTQDSICRALCAASGCMLMSVDYRLAPEHKFPAAPDDCYAATCWAADHAATIGAIPNRIAVGGDSAGAVLAAGVALRARDQFGPIIQAQLLFYGDMAYPGEMNESMREYSEGPILNLDEMRMFWDLYLNDPQVEQHHPWVSPMRATHHRRLPPAFIGTAECDVARDGAEAYAEKLRKADVPVELRRYAGMPHGFYAWSDIVPQAQEAIDEAAHWLQHVLTVGRGKVYSNLPPRKRRPA